MCGNCDKSESTRRNKAMCEPRDTIIRKQTGLSSRFDWITGCANICHFVPFISTGFREVWVHIYRQFPLKFFIIIMADLALSQFNAAATLPHPLGANMGYLPPPVVRT